MDEIIPALSSSTAGPLGLCHLPRLWLKILLHATGKLPNGFRHGTGGMDAYLLSALGLDPDAFIAFIETELPTYPQCERWVRAHAKDLSAESIAAMNHVLLNQKKPDNAVERSFLAAKQRFIGIDDPAIIDPVLLNDLDDWTALHAQVTAGSVPPLRPSDLNSAFAERLKRLYQDIAPSHVTLRMVVPRLGMEPAVPRAEVKQPGLTPMLITSPTGTATMDGATSHPDTPGAVDYLRRELRPLVQIDLSQREPDTGFPAELVERYGMGARMLGPIVVDGELVGWISVYERSARGWSPQDVAALEAAAGRIAEMLVSALENPLAPPAPAPAGSMP